VVVDRAEPHRHRRMRQDAGPDRSLRRLVEQLRPDGERHPRDAPRRGAI